VRISEPIEARFEALQRQLDDGSGIGELTAVVADLRSAVEQLRVTAEELRARNEELEGARTLLEAEQLRYRELFDLAPVGYVVTDLRGVVVELNEAAAELLARQPRELVGKPLPALVGTERRRVVRALIREAAKGARWQDEVPFLQPDGGRLRLVVHAVGPAGGGSTIRWSLADLASAPGSSLGGRRDEAGAQRIERSRLAALLDRLQHAVVAVGPTLRISYANAAAEQLLAEGASLEGNTLFDPWPDPSLRTVVASVFEHGGDPVEVRVMLEDDRRAYEVVVLPPDTSGDALLVIADVSAGQRRERAEREFIANAAHQLRTPVSAIASAVEVLQGGAKEVPEARDRFLAHVDRQCVRLVRLTRALLVLARAQALSEAPELELVALRPLLEALARGVRPASGVDVHVECPVDLAALTNRDLLEQALGNLAENAAKHTAAGEIVLCAELASAGAVRIVVSDTGPGGRFPTDGSFERFYRDPDADDDGFGLGLAIAAEAVRVLHGNLRIASGEGGTRIEVTLPSARMRPR
jgi:two-component system phosphate regulon sensor histidine kinase PhoR